MVVWPDGRELAVEGVCDGTIATAERGGAGLRLRRAVRARRRRRAHVRRDDRGRQARPVAPRPGVQGAAGRARWTVTTTPRWSLPGTSKPVASSTREAVVHERVVEAHERRVHLERRVPTIRRPRAREAAPDDLMGVAPAAAAHQPAQLRVPPAGVEVAGHHRRAGRRSPRRAARGRAPTGGSRASGCGVDRDHPNRSRRARARRRRSCGGCRRPLVRSSAASGSTGRRRWRTASPARPGAGSARAEPRAVQPTAVRGRELAEREDVGVERLEGSRDGGDPAVDVQQVGVRRSQRRAGGVGSGLAAADHERRGHRPRRRRRPRPTRRRGDRRPVIAAPAASGTADSADHGINERPAAATRRRRPRPTADRRRRHAGERPAAPCGRGPQAAHPQPRRSIGQRSSTSSPSTSQATSCIAIVGSTWAGTTRTRSPTTGRLPRRRERDVLVAAEPHAWRRRSTGCRGPCRAPSARRRRRRGPAARRSPCRRRTAPARTAGRAWRRRCPSSA